MEKYREVEGQGTGWAVTFLYPLFPLFLVSTNGSPSLVIAQVPHPCCTILWTLFLFRFLLGVVT